MTFHNDQLFYAAIWWAAGLDGAEAFTADVQGLRHEADRIGAVAQTQ